MDEHNGWECRHATDDQRKAQAGQIIDHVFETIRPQAVAGVEAFLSRRVSATVFMEFEWMLQLLVRSIGRLILQTTVQALEPCDAALMPKDIWFDGGGYRRRSDRTANRSIATSFGNIIL